MRVLFTTAPLRGHLFPMVPLAWAARAAGHEVLVATTEDFVPAVLGAGLPAVAWGPPVDFPATVARTGGTDPAHRPAGTFAGAFGRIAAGCRSAAGALLRSWRPDLVVAERAEYAGPLAAAEAGVSHVTYHWGISELADYRAAACDELGVDRLPDPALVLDPWPVTMRLPHGAGHHDVRAVPYNGDALLTGWDAAPPTRPRICVTLGTVLPALGGPATGPRVDALLGALGKLDVELVLAGIGDAPAGMAAAVGTGGRAGVVRAGHVSLAHVLPWCDLLVSHGGQGSVLTALAAGCPQLLLPRLDDQFDTAEAVVRRGAGLHLAPAEVDPGAVADRCRRLLDDADHAVAAAKLADEIAAQPAPARAVALLEDQVGR